MFFDCKHDRGTQAFQGIEGKIHTLCMKCREIIKTKETTIVKIKEKEEVK